MSGDIDPLELAKNSPLTEPQAKAYVSRVIDMEPREETIARAGVQASGVDDRLRRARQNLTPVFDLLSFMGANGLIPVRRSNSKTWHRVDARGCEYAWSVFPNASYEERLVRSEDLDQLAGDLCTNCFVVSKE